jgi:hypothetical protein
MKKRLLIPFIILLFPPVAGAQDTAEAIVGRYLRMLNYQALPKDSTLVVETTISFFGSSDTLRMRRCYAPEGMMRVELWQGDSLTTGYCTNGTTRFRKYMPYMQWWDNVSDSLLERDMLPYDFRGPLYNWREQGITLDYRGQSSFKGQQLQVVRARQKDHYTRLYMFEEQSGLLVVILEEDDLPVDDRPYHRGRISPIQYKVLHEYLPVGESLVPSQESFMRDNKLTVMKSTAHFVPRDPLLFNQD